MVGVYRIHETGEPEVMQWEQVDPIRYYREQGVWTEPEASSSPLKEGESASTGNPSE